MKIKWLALLLIVLFFHDGYSQKIDWNDSIPKYISATGAKLSLNKDFVKEGSSSLQWQWSSPSVLTIENPALFKKAVNTYRGGLTMWIYNDKPVDSALQHLLCRCRWFDPLLVRLQPRIFRLESLLGQL